MNENEVAEKVEDILDEFDFMRVVHVMSFLEWRWASCDGVPTIGDLRRCARRLLRDAAQRALRYNEVTSNSTGGFRAEAWINEDINSPLGLRLAFEVVEFGTD